MLSLTGGVLGLVLGYAGVRWLLAINPGDIPRIGETGAGVGIDWRVLAFTLVVSLGTGILFGLFPAIGASRPDLHSTLKESSNRSGTSYRQNKARSLLVISEVSLALVLLVGAALLIRTFVNLRGVDPGFNSHNVLTMYMSLTPATASRKPRASRSWRGWGVSGSMLSRVSRLRLQRAAFRLRAGLVCRSSSWAVRLAKKSRPAARDG